MAGDVVHGSETEEPASAHGDVRLRGVLDALARAAKQAHLIAYETGTGVVERRDGKLGVYPPDPAMYEDLIPRQFEGCHEL